MLLTKDQLKALLSAAFPDTAKCWSLATAEIRDMCRHARELAGVGIEEAIVFADFKTPAAWNLHGVAGTVYFYGKLTDDQRKAFCAYFGHWLNDWKKLLPA